jgi:hypothetical protein
MKITEKNSEIRLVSTIQSNSSTTNVTIKSYASSGISVELLFSFKAAKQQKKNAKVQPLRHEGTKKRNMKAGSNPVRRETKNAELFIDGIDMRVKHKIVSEAAPQTDESMRNRM